MSQYIYLGQIPHSPSHRQQLLSEYDLAISQSIQSGSLAIIQPFVQFLMTAKGYKPEDLVIGKAFDFTLPDASFRINADILITINENPLVYVKCAIASLESWERYASAFCRTALKDYTIPFAIITNNEQARFIKASDGTLISEQLEDLPVRASLLELVQSNPVAPLPPQRLQKELRILYAFDAIKCSSDLCT